MKKLLLPSVILIFSLSAHSQGLWQANGNGTVYTLRKTGIGTNNPTAALDVNGRAKFRGNTYFDSLLTAFTVQCDALNVLTDAVIKGSIHINKDAHVNGILTVGSPFVPCPKCGPASGGSIIFDAVKGSIVSSSGKIDFDGNDLVTTGSIFAKNATVSGTLNAQTILQNGNPINQSQWSTNPDGSISYNGQVFVKRLDASEGISIGNFKFKNSTVPAPIKRDTISAPNKLVIESQTKAIELSADTVTMKEFVGIGKTPTAALDVAGDIKASGAVSADKVFANSLQVNNISASGDITANCVHTSCLKVSGQTQFDSIRTKKLKVGGSITIDGYPSGPVNAIYTDLSGDPSLYIQSNSDDFNTLINSGNNGMLGIGQFLNGPFPSAKLHVGQLDKFTSALKVHKVVCTKPERLADPVGCQPNIMVVSKEESGSFPALVENIFVITDTGTVRIGKQTVVSGSHGDYKLSVDGKIVAKQIASVDPSFWADDELLTITATTEELEKEQNFIIKFGHLQKVPSEKEIFKNGIIMDEMFAIQLRKIEQLFKYSFLFKDDISALKQENKELKNKMSDMQKQMNALQQEITLLMKTK